VKSLTLKTIPWLLGILLITLLGCSGSKELTRKDRADRAFARSDWAAAIQDYQIYLEEMGLGDEAMMAHYMLARSYFENSDYPTAAVEFEIFQRDYPRSDSLSAAAYYEALCWLEQSPAFDRDAGPTLKAIRKLEDFLIDFPGSPETERARASILELRDRLAKKSLATARLYRRMERRQAAVIYYEKLLRSHPESSHAEPGALELIELWLEMDERGKAMRLVESIASAKPDSDLAVRARSLLEN
jgi:outer membrane assembly lipoprotein YfiO